MDSSLPKNGRSEKGLFNMTTVCPRAPRGKKKQKQQTDPHGEDKKKKQHKLRLNIYEMFIFRFETKPLTPVQIIFNRSYSVGFIHGTAIVRSDRYSWCAAWFRIGSIAICYVYL